MVHLTLKEHHSDGLKELLMVERWGSSKESQLGSTLVERSAIEMKDVKYII